MNNILYRLEVPRTHKPELTEPIDMLSQFHIIFTYMSAPLLNCSEIITATPLDAKLDAILKTGRYGML
jgi:hypothetical protein